MKHLERGEVSQEGWKLGEEWTEAGVVVEREVKNTEPGERIGGELREGRAEGYFYGDGESGGIYDVRGIR